MAAQTRKKGRAAASQRNTPPPSYHEATMGSKTKKKKQKQALDIREAPKGYVYNPLCMDLQRTNGNQEEQNQIWYNRFELYELMQAGNIDDIPIDQLKQAVKLYIKAESAQARNKFQMHHDEVMALIGCIPKPTTSSLCMTWFIRFCQTVNGVVTLGILIATCHLARAEKPDRFGSYSELKKAIC